MSWNPPNKPSSFEHLRWKIPPQLDGLVLDSFKDLKEKLPADEVFGEVYLNQKGDKRFLWHEERFDRYSRNYRDHNLRVDVAYGCPECEKIIVGSPRIEDEDSIGMLTGRKGYDFYCKNCYAHLGEHTDELS